MIYTLELTTDCKVYLIMDAGIENALSFVAMSSEEAILYIPNGNQVIFCIDLPCDKYCEVF